MIFVTGATGILGRIIVLELLKRGKHVRASKRPGSNINEVKHSYTFYRENPDEFFNNELVPFAPAEPPVPTVYV